MCNNYCPLLKCYRREKYKISLFEYNNKTIETNAKLQCFYNDKFIPINFRIKDEEFYISSDKSIKFSNVLLFVSFKESIAFKDFQIYIITKNGFQYLILFDKSDEYNKVINKIIQLKLNTNNNFIIELNQFIEVIKLKKDFWTKNMLSTFEYITFLNFLIGRNYLNNAFYPLFPNNQNSSDKKLPIPTFSNDLSEVFKTNFFNEDDSQRFFTFPEKYFMLENDSFEDVYRNRKELENRSDIHLWVNELFKKTIPNINYLQNIIVDENIKRESNELNLSNIKKKNLDKTYFVSFMINKYIFYVTKDKLIEYFDIYENQTIQISHNKYSSFLFTEQKGKVFAYNGQELKTFLGPNKTPSVITANFQKLIVSEIAYVNHHSILNVGFLGEKPLNQFFLSEKVACLASSIKNKLIVIGSNDCKVRIRDMNDGKKISTFDLGNRLPKKILITKELGMILIYVENEIIVLSPNGKLLRTFSNAPLVNHWKSITCHNGIDYVLMTSKGRVYLFEAIHPEEMKPLAIDETKCTHATYDKENNCFVLVVSK